MNPQAQEVPLIELLRNVPKNSRLIVDSADGMCSTSHPVGRLCHEAAEALEQPPPKVEPFDVWAGTKPQEDVPIVFPRWDNGEPFEVRYPKQPAQEPVATIQQWEHKEGDKWIANELPWDEMPPVGTKLYTHPAPLQNEFAKTKSWQGLSDDEIQEELKKMWDKGLIPSYSIVAFARAIEAKLKEKNT